MMSRGSLGSKLLPIAKRNRGVEPRRGASRVDRLAYIERLLARAASRHPQARPDAIVQTLRAELGRIEKARDRTYETARQAARASAAHAFNYDIALTRLTVYLCGGIRNGLRTRSYSRWWM